MSDGDKVQAVQKVFYERTRMRTLFDHLDSIDALMNLDHTAPPLKTTDPRVHAGAGPTWFIPHTGKLSQSVIESADRCDQVAEVLLSIRSELAQVDFDASDKQHLRAALAEQAEAWRRRGQAWRAPGKPKNIDGIVAEIAGHERASLREFARVKKYLKKVDPRHL